MPFRDKSPVMQEFLNEAALNTYGRTISEALRKNVCVQCGKEPTFYSPAGANEYQISGLCEPCFDDLTSPE